MLIEIFGEDSPLSGYTKPDIILANNITGDTIVSTNYYSGATPLSTILKTQTFSASAITDYHFNAENVLYVKKNPGTSEFSSIYDAIQTITGSSDTNRYLISISTGIYVEPELTIPPYVYLLGDGNEATIIEPLGNHNAINLSNNSQINQLQIRYVASPYFAINCVDVGDFALTNKVSVVDAYGGINVSTVTGDTYMYCEYTDIQYCQVPVFHTSENNEVCELSLENFYIYKNNTFETDSIYLSGNGANLIFKLGGIINESSGGTGVRIGNDAHLDMANVSFQNLTNSIYSDGDNNRLNLANLLFENNSVDITILNSGTTGFYAGYVEYFKQDINIDSPFFITNKDTKIITVGKKGADFTSIAAAVQESKATATEPYIISVGAGVFIEPEIQVPAFTSVRGASINSTIVKPDSPNHHIFVMNEMVEISFLTIQDAGAGYAAIYSHDTGNFTQLHKLSIYNCDYGIIHTTDVVDSQMYVEYVDINAEFTNAVYVSGSTGTTTGFQAENFYTYNSPTFTGDTLWFNGDNVSVELLAFGLKGGATADTLIRISDNVFADVSSGFLDNCQTAIKVDGTNSTPTFKAASLTFANCDTNIDIQNTGATGNYTGYLEYEKINIPKASPFFVTNRDLNVITVAKKGGDFTSIKSAVDYITDNSISNRYLIKVSPGTYQEDTITCKQYVNIQGESQFNTVITSVSGNTLFVGRPNVEIRGLQIGGTTLSGATDACVIFNGGGTFRLNETRFAGNYRNLYLDTLSGGGLTICTTLSQDGVTQLGNFATVTDDGVNASNLIINSFNHGNAIPLTNVTDFFYINGTKSVFYLYNTLAGNAAQATTGNFIRANNGASVTLQNVVTLGYDTFFRNENTGSGITLKTLSTTSVECTNDFIIENSGTTGSIFGGFNQNKITIVDGAEIAVLFNDSTNTGVAFTGKLYQGQDWNTRTEISESIKHATNIGVDTGGEITYTGMSLSVHAGNGYVTYGISPNESIKQVIWTAQTLTLSANTFYYLYVDENAVVNKSETEPDYLKTILVGHVRTDSSGVTYVQNSKREGEYTVTRLDSTIRDAFGSIFKSGCIVSENVTPFKIDITAGEYWYSTNKYTPSSKTAAIFNTYYRNGSGGWITETGDTVQTKYDNGSGSTVSLTGSQFTKHAVYVVNDGAEQKNLLVYGQEIFGSQLDAENGALPSPPSFFTANIAPIAGVIVEGSATGITSIRDIRPTLSFKAESASASNIHGNLLGLGANDHPQYLLVDGTSQMTGDLNLGSNNIYNVSNITATTYYSGATSLQNIFANKTELNNYLSLTGGTINGDLTITGNSILNSLTATTIFSGNSNLNTIFAPIEHTHPISAITGLQAALDSKVDNTVFTAYTSTTNTTINGKLDTTAFTAYTASTIIDINNKANRSGDTFTGQITAPVISATSISATTYYGDGSNLTGIVDNYVTGGTFSGTTLTLNRQNGTVVITGFTSSGVDTYVTGFTYTPNRLTISQNEGQPPLNVDINEFTALTINGNLTATTIFSGSTNISDIFLNKNGYIRQKSGGLSGTLFVGNPRKATVTFTTPYSTTNYSIAISSDTNRTWTWENKTVSGFTISSNSNTAFNAGTVDWTTTEHGEGFK